jgi:hypothetical protein
MRQIVLDTRELLALSDQDKIKLKELLAINNKNDVLGYKGIEKAKEAEKITKYCNNYANGTILLNEAMSFFSHTETLFAFLEAFKEIIEKRDNIKIHLGKALYEEGGLYVWEFIDIIDNNNLTPNWS